MTWWEASTQLQTAGEEKLPDPWMLLGVDTRDQYLILGLQSNSIVFAQVISFVPKQTIALNAYKTNATQEMIGVL